MGDPPCGVGEKGEKGKQKAVGGAHPTPKLYAPCSLLYAA